MENLILKITILNLSIIGGMITILAFNWRRVTQWMDRADRKDARRGKRMEEKLSRFDSVITELEKKGFFEDIESRRQKEIDRDRERKAILLALKRQGDKIDKIKTEVDEIRKKVLPI